MALIVRTSSNNAITTTVGSAAPNINTTVRKISLPLVNLEELKNVDSDDLDNGYTLIYDSVEEKWVAQSPDELELNLQNIDGGTY